jgi:outer membrane protein assembly factor BamB
MMTNWSAISLAWGCVLATFLLNDGRSQDPFGSAEVQSQDPFAIPSDPVPSASMSAPGNAADPFGTTADAPAVELPATNMETSPMASPAVVAPVQPKIELPASAATSDLVIHWQSQVEQPLRQSTRVAMTIWPHSTHRKQQVTIRMGGKIIQQVSGDALDRQAWEKRLAEASVRGDRDTKQVLASTPRLGLEGARANIAPLESRLKLLGRKFEKDEIDRPMIYLVSTSASGVLQVMDAESGETIWTTQVGSPSQRTYPAGVSDDYVAIINGLDLYVYGLRSGKMLNSRRCQTPAGGGAMPIGNWILVPGQTGTMVAYHATDTKQLPWVQRFGGRCEQNPVVSGDRRFVAWNTGGHFLTVARVDSLTKDRPALWNRFQSSEVIVAPPAVTPGGFALASDEGTLVHMALPSPSNPTVRSDAIRWRIGTGESLTRPMLYCNGRIFASNVSGELLAFDSEAGRLLWRSPRGMVRRLVGASPSLVYVQGRDRLLAVSAEDGHVVKATSSDLGDAILNTVNDRLLFLDGQGIVTCLRESVALQPQMHVAIDMPASRSARPSASPVPSGDAAGAESSTAPAGEQTFESADPFGGDNAAPAADTADPFSAPPAGSGDANPFG